MRHAIVAIVSAVLLAGLLFVSSRRTGPLPPLGSFLEPVHGVWSVALQARMPHGAALLGVLDDSVRIVYDGRGVPHIFAHSIPDAMRALGYVEARDRLFQLDVETRATAGRLTELLGPRALPLDRHMRRLGLARAAERVYAEEDSLSEGRKLSEAFAQGVDAWIDHLGPRGLPLEYHLLDARPLRWKPVYSAYLLMRMGYTLTYSRADLLHLEAEARVGRAAADALYPVDAPIQEPIQPGPGPYPRVDSSALPPPGPPDTAVAHLAGALSLTLGGTEPLHSALTPAPLGSGVVGSNNWAVSPGRTAAGDALLAGDPHLTLTLPSIWYEVQLVVPGQLDAYGVTIPGVPGIVIGFNRDIAWSFTNTGADVLDFYREHVDNASHPSRYEVDGDWRPLDRRIEVYRGRSGQVLATDTLYSTFRGPLLRTPFGDLSMRWTVLDAPYTGGLWIALPRATSVRGFFDAGTVFAAPAQNMVVADRQGHIGIRSTGWFPIRPGNGRGNVIRDGSTTASDWTGRWPVDRYPQGLDPRQGYLASANQQPIDPRVDSTYLGQDWLAPWRAMDINALLRADSAVTPDAMRRFQTSPLSSRANMFVPALLAAAARRQQPGDTALAAAAAILAHWDRRYTPDNRAAVLFDLAMREVQHRTWDELRGGPGPTLPPPSEAVLARLLADSASIWWDDRATPTVEHRDDILAASLRAAYDSAVHDYGPPGDAWRWSRFEHANIYHLLGLPALSDLNVSVQGGPGTLNPIAGRGTHGPSWRMVVQLGPQVRAWGVLPGGEAGNPASPFYDDRVAEWAAGRLDPIPFVETPGQVPDVSGSLLLRPGR